MTLVHSAELNHRPVIPEFRPPLWLRNGHTQSMLASLGVRKNYVTQCTRELVAASREVVLMLPEGVRLHAVMAQHTEPHDPRLVVLIHGWEGSADSMYLRSAAGYLFDHGFDVIRLHLRDHGPSHELNQGLFHSCRLQEAVDAVVAIHNLFPEHRLCLGGFSLGGNFSLRIAAKAAAANLPLTKVFAVCPVLDPEETLNRLDAGFFGYSWYFLKKWRRSLREKQRLFPDAYEFRDIDKMNLAELTEHCVVRYSEFENLSAYLRGYAVVGDVLSTIITPTQVLLATDDPIIAAEDAQHLASPRSLRVDITKHGGHCGYITGISEPSFADLAMADFFSGTR